METGHWALLIAVLTLGITGFLLWQRRDQPVTLTGILEAGEDAVPIAKTLAEVSTIGVQAAEQLWVTGKLPRDERLAYALAYVKSWSPALAKIENEKIYGAIESAVLVANALRAQAGTLNKTPKLVPPGAPIP